MQRRAFLAGTATTAAFICVPPLSARAADSGSFAPNLLEITHLPRFQPVTLTANFSSYDRTGGNDDGGPYAFLRKDADGLVIAEMTGAGVITHIHTPSPPDANIAFYFDGEAIPRIEMPFRELFSGKNAPFTGALVCHALGGYYSYVPLEFEKSMKVVVRGDHMYYYDLNYALYAPGVKARSYQKGDSFTMPRVDMAGKTIRATHKLIPGRALTLFETKKPGRILSLALSPASAFAGKARDMIVRIYWDNSAYPAVDVPAGDFFGYSFGRPATKSLLYGTEGDIAYMRFPMPFERAARIELISQRSHGPLIDLNSEIIVSPVAKSKDEAWFHAVWKRENPTTTGVPFTYIDEKGRGHIVGVSLQAQGDKVGYTGFFEGDEEADIDGHMQIHGTGSEDSFNGGWYALPGLWNDAGSTPFSGCLEYERQLGRTGAYRLMISDAYRFNEHINYNIEHGPVGNKDVTDYVGVTYLYLDRANGRSQSLPSVAQRTVNDPDGFLWSFSPSPPIVSALFAAAIDMKTEQVKGHWYGYMAFNRNISWYSQWTPPEKLPLDGDINNYNTESGAPRLALKIKVAKAGSYTIMVEGMTGPDMAILRLLKDGEFYGQAADFYTAEQGESVTKDLGQLDLVEGENEFWLALSGRNPKSNGVGVNLVSLAGKRA